MRNYIDQEIYPRRPDILPAVVEKILCHNARTLYGLA